MLFISLLSGFMAAFLSLIFSLVLALDNPGNLGLALIAVIEELLKFSFLLFLAQSSSQLEKKKTLFANALFLGAGFGIFETALIFFDQQIFSSTFLVLLAIHMLSTLIFSLGIYQYLSRKTFSSFFPSLPLAIIFHLCYNLIVKYLS